MNNIVKEIKEALAVLSIPEKAEFFPRFFKTGKGEYGEGDVFLGVTVPDQRSVAKEYYKKVELNDLSVLLSSQYHEYRLTALFMLISKFEKTKDLQAKEKIVTFYLNHLPHINNWDLVDSSCYKILGRYAFENDKEYLLRELSESEEMWHKRIAVVGTMHYVKKGSFDLTKEFVARNLKHPHDLMHKANGWLLREMGNKSETELIAYLNQYYKEMPRTCLRYAIEKLDEDLRQNYLKGRV
ncbi:DNA alkylation repair protein [Chryseobacterium indologenes]|uniref:DNA alkylation repair protein n=1 Tax=Chryseobacterium indologenes TaxID=253 RepID=UPI000BFB74C8|nr:DNA alkylation repair protein [Chryseobacterium indologenes]ATN07367.1 DNA alkylation repair protein [Chryseobacterium indologenes]AYY83895.1 DNA alkylation repair protein [Chryseobacterium indologenes]QIX80823.1 DNA alkylation repair protein [Chryseobacterium indologenes]TLX27611.1 DNA alkylation repair protein [Chryseobacterium indologenes]UDQ54486.1 DNA alkylation repair protein [Chryseobacterium indologenes]